ncbi:hypothetical protein A2U01_0050904, partial [Trifolium medium]|nr:hypothetical protein [Trifolium medium]
TVSVTEEIDGACESNNAVSEGSLMHKKVHSSMMSLALEETTYSSCRKSRHWKMHFKTPRW